MNEFLDFFTDMTMVAAVTTASHFGVTIEAAESRQTAAGLEAQRTVRRTAVTSSCGKPAARCVRTPAR